MIYSSFEIFVVPLLPSLCFGSSHENSPISERLILNGRRNLSDNSELRSNKFWNLLHMACTYVKNFKVVNCYLKIIVFIQSIQFLSHE